MSDSEDKNKGTQEAVQIPLKFVIPDDHEVKFSNYATVQHDDLEFCISFFQIRRPIIMGEKVEEKLKNVKSVDAVCVSSISMSLGRLPSFIKALESQLESIKSVIDETGAPTPKDSTT